MTSGMDPFRPLLSPRDIDAISFYIVTSRPIKFVVLKSEQINCWTCGGRG